MQIIMSHTLLVLIRLENNDRKKNVFYEGNIFLKGAK